MKIIKNWKIGLPLLVIIICFLAFLLAPNDPEKINLSMRLQPPSLQYPFGTDTQGRCLLSRILYGSRLSTGVVLGSAVLVILTACPIGLMMGYAGNRTGWLADSILNSVTALPPIAYLMVFIGAWGNGIFTTFLALTFSIFPRLVKLIKTKTEIERNKAYVLCAVVSGAGKTRQMFQHILPNCVKEIITFMSLMCAEMIMMVTSFSFIGIGLGDNVVDLGGIIQEAYQVVLIRPHILLFPIVFVVLISLSFNLLGQNVN